MIATAIITAHRGRPTLQASIESWRMAGFTGPLMVLSDDTPNASTVFGYPVKYNEPRLGNLRNWVLALETIYSETDARWLMVCEDDITWAAGVADRLLQDLELFAQTNAYARTGAQSLYCPARVSDDLERKYASRPLKPGWYGVNHGMKTWGAQCLVFSRDQASMLLNSKSLQTFLDSPRWTKNVDAIVAECLQLVGLEIRYRIPSLVNHDLGNANSSLGHKDERPALETKYFTGAA